MATPSLGRLPGTSSRAGTVGTRARQVAARRHPPHTAGAPYRAARGHGSDGDGSRNPEEDDRAGTGARRRPGPRDRRNRVEWIVTVGNVTTVPQWQPKH